ncbi:MAG: YhcH/YjgK/YiaL family protein [Bacteroidales bacterium]|nr:YhcH/YjgK/YiaL family protein [Bacteroidales bacterium]
MITDIINNAAIYSKLRPGIRKALIYVVQTDLAKLPPGQYTLDDSGLTAIISEYQTHEYMHDRWEAHRKFIDVQFLIKGAENMGYTFNPPKSTTIPYNEGKDIVFYNADGFQFPFTENCFAVFYPGELHQPGICNGNPLPVKKIVIKVPFNEYE